MKADLVVIGGGIVGAGSAFYASRAGFDVVLVEKRPALATLTTAAAVACFRAQWDHPDYAYLMRGSIEVYEHFAEVVGIPDYEIDLRQQGWVFMTGDPAGPAVLAGWIEGQRKLGLQDSEFLTGDEVRRRFPWASGQVLAATFRQKDGWLSPHEVTYGFAKGSQARFLLETEAQEVLVSGGRVKGVRTNRGFIEAPIVVIAAGPFSARLARTAGVELPVTLLRRQRVFIAPRPEIPPDAPMTADFDTKVYWRPEAGGGAFLGWALPEEPSEPLDEVPTDWTFPAVVLEGAARLSPFWAQVAETLKREEVTIGAGQYTCTLDGKPIIGPCPDVQGLFFNTACNGYGIESCPQGCQHLVGLITGQLSDADNPFRFGREMRAGEKLVL